jgi:hypothetical protein
MGQKLLSDFVGVSLDGTVVPVKQATTTVNMGGVVREPVLGPGGKILGYTEQTVEATIGFTSAVPQGTNIEETYNLVGQQIKLTDDQGGEWLMTNATRRNPEEISAGAGDLAVEYFGDKIVQL